MKEIIFIRQNKKKWLKYEEKVKYIKNLPTDELSDIYIDVTSDLAYSQSHYPEARITQYLNNMLRTLQDYIYTPQKRNLSKIITLFKDDVPNIIADARNEMLLSFGIFMVFVIIGIILALQSMDNVIETLGADYVDMTIENIKKGVPTDVYGKAAPDNMFLRITHNNIAIALKTYGWGIIPILGPGYILMSNGIMLGEFQTMFFNYGVGLESMTAIWIHGTLEISAIIISGAAAFSLGNGWVSPGTLSRSESLKRSGLRSVKILFTTIPLLLMAGFLESFVTRHTEYPLFIKLFIIFGSLAFIVFYYVYIPHKIRGERKSIKERELPFKSVIEM